VTDLDAASVAAMKDGDLEGYIDPFPGSRRLNPLCSESPLRPLGLPSPVLCDINLGSSGPPYLDLLALLGGLGEPTFAAAASAPSLPLYVLAWGFGFNIGLPNAREAPWMAAFWGVEDTSLESGDLLVSEVIWPRRDRGAIYERGLVEGRACTGRMS
jgi:hypothetical protein